jgi:hypothetical protein
MRFKRRDSMVDRASEVGARFTTTVRALVPHAGSLLALLTIAAYAAGVIAITLTFEPIHASPKQVGIDLHDYLLVCGAFLFYVLTPLFLGFYLRTKLSKRNIVLSAIVALTLGVASGVALMRLSYSGWDTAVAWSTFLMLAFFGSGIRVTWLQVGVILAIVATILLYLFVPRAIYFKPSGGVEITPFPIGLVVKVRGVRVVSSEDDSVDGRCFLLMGDSDGFYVLSSGVHHPTYFEPVATTSLAAGC